MNSPLGKTRHYAVLVKLLVRGIPHIHYFIWIIKAPKLNIEPKEDISIGWWYYTNRNPAKEKELSELVKTFETHRHSKTRRKYHNKKCRFHFERFFSHEAIVAEPLPNTMPETIKIQVLKNRNDLLSKVKSYTDTELKMYQWNNSFIGNIRSWVWGNFINIWRHRLSALLKNDHQIIVLLIIVFQMAYLHGNLDLANLDIQPSWITTRQLHVVLVSLGVKVKVLGQWVKQ